MARLIPARRSLTTTVVVSSAVAALLVSGGCAQAGPPTHTTTKAPARTTAKAAPKAPTYAALPDLGMVVEGYGALWRSSGKNDLHGTVLSPATLQRNDEIASWINQHATKNQQFRAMQNSAYMNGSSGYDQSLTIADGFGKRLGAMYVEGRLSGKLPLTSALLRNAPGTLGIVVGTDGVKRRYSHPRPYLRADASAPATAGDSAACRPSVVNSSSLTKNRVGKPWADSKGNLKITRVADVVDRTRAFARSDVKLSVGYGSSGLCASGSYPSGHAVTAFQVGLTLATMVPEAAPGILARTSEAAMNRVVLGAHYPLDVVAGRMYAEATVATRWADPAFRNGAIEPARRELVAYLTKTCTAAMHVKTLQACVAADTPYTDNPFNGAKVPGGSSQIVTNRADALRVYTERLSYGFAPTSSNRKAAAVPGRAVSLLRTAFPTLTDAQRLAVLGQTEIASGHPLAAGNGVGWQRLNLAAAMSATVRVTSKGAVTVVKTGGAPTVMRVK